MLTVSIAARAIRRLQERARREGSHMAEALLFRPQSPEDGIEPGHFMVAAAPELHAEETARVT